MCNPTMGGFTPRRSDSLRVFCGRTQETFWSSVMKPEQCRAALLLQLLVALVSAQMSEEQESSLVAMHNLLRSRVQPAAAFMRKVVWDETLRLVAEGYAAKCIWEHNPELENVGEKNLFITTGAFNVTQATLEWFEERLDYDYESNSCPEGRMCGHYTQMVWANSSRMGCATHFCDSVENLKWSKATILVCNYFPPGNYEGKRPYEAGEPCSRCSEHLLECEERLCVSESSGDAEDTSDSPVQTRTEAPDVPAEPAEVTRGPVLRVAVSGAPQAPPPLLVAGLLLVFLL